MTKLQKLRFSSLLILGFFVMSVAYHYWQAYYGGRDYPHSTYLYGSGDIGLASGLGLPMVSQVSALHCFGDFFITWAQNIELNPYRPSAPIVSNYLPFAHVVTLPFSFSSYPLSICLFLTFLVGSSLAFSWFSFRDVHTDRWENAKLVLIFGLLTYPMQMAADRGNIDIVVFLFVWGGLAQYRRRSKLSAFWLACATAMKGFPGLLLGLFLADRNYRALFYALFWCGLLSAASLCVFEGGFWVNLNHMLRAAERYSAAVSIDDPRYIQHTSGWFGMTESLALWFPSLAKPGTLLQIIRENYAIVRGFLLLYFVVPLLGIRRLELWQVAAPLTFIMAMLLPAAYDYRLILILVPFALFINSRRSSKMDFWYVLLFSLLLVPKQFAIISADIGVGTVINPLIMLLITGMILWELASKRKGYDYALQLAAKPAPNAAS